MNNLEDNRAEIAGRITASRQFARSPRLCALLGFVLERHLAGRNQELTEPVIAAQVFGRREDFDPSDDNIVRVSMRQLRAKLKEYYEEEGRDEFWIVEIPKGGYIPTVLRREDISGLPAPGKQDGRPRDTAVRGVLLALLAALLVAAVLLWRENARLRAGAIPARQTRSALAEAVIRSGQKTIVVPVDSGLSLMELMAGRPGELSEYLHEKPWPVPPLFNHPAGRRLWEQLEVRHLTHASLVSLGQHLVRQDPSADVSFRHPRTLSARDFKADNFVLLGMTNPWLSLFEPQLNFVLGEGYPRRPGTIVNRAPRPGEPPEYVVSQAPSSRSYARVALVPNLSGNGRVLLLTGLGSYKTEAAAEFLSSPDSAAILRKTLSLPAGSPLPGFELVLEVEEIDKTGTSARVLAWRVNK